MTRTSFYRLDWRAQFETLRPYLEGRGGIVHVHATGESSPKHAFVKALRAEMQTDKWRYKHSILMASCEDPETHYIPDIVRQGFIAFGLGMPPADESVRTSITIGEGIKAGRDVTISEISIAPDVDQRLNSNRHDKSVRLLCEELKEALKTRRCAFVFIDTHNWDKKDLDILGQRLWAGALEELIELGLLVVDIFDPLRMANRSYFWPPEPFDEIKLPEQFDGATYAHAVEDLAAIAAAEGWFENAEVAQAFAEGVLGASFSIQDAYARLGLAVRRAGASNASPR